MTAISTPADVVKAAMSIATDAAEGRLDPAQLEHQAVGELSALMLIEPDAGSDLEALQAESARRVLARGGIPTDELAEWLAVQRRRENPDAATDGQGGAEPPPGADVLTDADSNALELYSGESGTAPADADLEPRLVEVLAALAADPKPTDAEPAPVENAGCKCRPTPIHRGPRGGTVLAVGRGVPIDPRLRPL
jgi:hypothetical protein